jgi:hypothetical protein
MTYIRSLLGKWGQNDNSIGHLVSPDVFLDFPGDWKIIVTSWSNTAALPKPSPNIWPGQLYGGIIASQMAIRIQFNPANLAGLICLTVYP